MIIQATVETPSIPLSSAIILPYITLFKESLGSLDYSSHARAESRPLLTSLGFFMGIINEIETGILCRAL